MLNDVFHFTWFGSSIAKEVGNYFRSYLKYITEPYRIWQNPKPIAQNNKPYPRNQVESNPNTIMVIPKYRTPPNVYLLALTHAKP